MNWIESRIAGFAEYVRTLGEDVNQADKIRIIKFNQNSDKQITEGATQPTNLVSHSRRSTKNSETERDVLISAIDQTNLIVFTRAFDFLAYNFLFVCFN